jgi:hypothetical protein
MIGHYHLNSGSGSAMPARSLFTRRIEGVAIPSCAAIAISALKTYQGGEVSARGIVLRCF